MKHLVLILAVLCVCCMSRAAVVTISEPSADQRQRQLYNGSRMQRANSVVLDTGQKFAVVAINLAPGVDQPGDYAVLKTAIEEIAGVQAIKLMVDGQCPASIPADHSIKLWVTVHPRIDPNPEPPPE